jgi:predicted small secreted protein
MSIEYLTHAFGIIHLIRFICLIVLLIMMEIKLSPCNSSLNEYFGFNHQSILFYYILIWISFAYEIYFFINRLFASIKPQAKRSIFILYIFLSIAFTLASCFTLYAIIYSIPGHVITQHDFDHSSQYIIPITPDCNLLRLIGILLGFSISILYLIAVILIYRL